MSDPKDFVAVVDSDARKTPRRIAFITKRTSPQVRVKDEERVMKATRRGVLRTSESRTATKSFGSLISRSLPPALHPDKSLRLCESARSVRR